jgi:hypothetical protein
MHAWPWGPDISRAAKFRDDKLRAAAMNPEKPGEDPGYQPRQGRPDTWQL